MWKEYNPSPTGNKTDDCVVRALAKVTNTDWETAYIRLVMNGFAMGLMPNNSATFSATMRKNGFYRKAIPNTCPDCYTVADFAEDNPEGTYVLASNNHVVAVVDGDIYDMYDSSSVIPLFVWYREGDEPMEDEDEL
ncbi:MAG: hypothetical protein IKU35_06410 [Bacteroidaceae bacterium]|nr:hypothetical protein [Bacteroidaceae bacterium]